MGRKATNAHSSSDGKFSNEKDSSFIRKQVDPEAANYFREIAEILECGNVDVEERPYVCGNALEEARGKEVELATDQITSFTLQTLLEGCDVDNLCLFLRSCAKNFAHISTDSCGSHVAETALNSLAVHVQDEEYYSTIKESLTLICQNMASKPIDVMCDCYGSHVLRSLLCVCKGVHSNSEFHTAKSATVLSQRLNLRADKAETSNSQFVHQGFPELLKFLVSEMLKCSKADIAILQRDQYSSLTALRLLAGQDEELLSIIPVILGCGTENTEEGRLITSSEVQNIKNLIKENAFSHLMEIILEVAPDVLYDEIFDKVFKDSLFDLSCHPSANFAVQALISYSRSKSHIKVICVELGSKFKDLLELGKAGVVASIISATQKIQTNEDKCSKALADSVTSGNEPPKHIVPRLLFLDSYINCRDKANWSWASSSRVHFMGSLILQLIFKYPSQYIQPYIKSIITMESDHVTKVAKDVGGARVIESFLSSNAADKHKKKLVGKLKGHFGELAMHPSGSFTVSKCFSVSDVPLREAIVSELVTIQKELSKTKQGPGLVKSFDVDGYNRRPEQWRTSQNSKISVYKDFLAEFDTEKSSGPPNKKNKTTFLDDSKKGTQQGDMKKLRQEINYSLASLEASKDKKEKRKKKDNEGKPAHKKPRT
ncbi:hypothetical protein V2J09_002861 [Rumex salicifolius]